VSVPANPNALQLAKSLHIPELHLNRVFSKAAPDTAVQMAMQSARLEIIKLGGSSILK
jgi:hypothetical protein